MDGIQSSLPSEVVQSRLQVCVGVRGAPRRAVGSPVGHGLLLVLGAAGDAHRPGGDAGNAR